MALVANHLLESGVLVEEHVVQRLLCGLVALLLDLPLVYVVLDVGLVLVAFEGVAADALLIAVEDNAFEDGRRGQGVFHPTHDLEAVVIELRRRGDRSVAEAVLEVVLQQEGIGNFVEVEGVFVG